MKNKKIFSCIAGSYLYGTNVEGSDRDYKKIVIPQAEDLILQNGGWTARHKKRLADEEKGDPLRKQLDTETMSLKHFINMAVQGQSITLDLLFAPREVWLSTSPEWEYIIANREKLVNGGIKKIVDYCQTQAGKYSVKGDRLNAFYVVKEILEKVGPYSRLSELDATWKELHQVEGIIQVKSTYNERQGKTEYLLEVCGRMINYTATAKYALSQMDIWIKEYGKRAKLAAEANGSDWKAMMHAVRIATQAEELLKTRHMTLPLQNRGLLLDIRNGKIPFEEVKEMIEGGVQRVEKAMRETTLPETSDVEFWNGFLVHTYKKWIKDNEIPGEGLYLPSIYNTNNARG